MRRPSFVLTFGLTLVATAALAHGPTPKKVDETIEIKADPKAVWDLVKSFPDIAKWDPELKESTGKDKKRVMTFQNGQKLEEEADTIDDKAMSYEYRMLDPNVKALPVSSYSATLTVTPSNGGSKVEWSARYYRADTGNEPAEGMDDAAGKEAMTKFFRAGLEGIKSKVEKKS